MSYKDLIISLESKDIVFDSLYAIQQLSVNDCFNTAKVSANWDDQADTLTKELALIELEKDYQEVHCYV